MAVQVHQLQTHTQKKYFAYLGSVATETTLIYGTQFLVSTVSNQVYQSLFAAFPTNPVKKGDIDDWLVANLTQRKLVGYVLAILEREGYAAVDGKEVTFKTPNNAKAKHKTPAKTPPKKAA